MGSSYAILNENEVNIVQILIDGDGCPVVDITIRLATEFHIPCFLLCDTAHQFQRDGAVTLVFDKGADSVDFSLVNRVNPGDLVVTQDYGLASMCLARKALPIHQDGWAYTEYNIDALMFSRHESRKLRNAGVRMKGPKKRTSQQDQAYESFLRQLLQTSVQG